jgi:hypothetical protein
MGRTSTLPRVGRTPKLVDLSAPIEQSPEELPEPLRVKLEYSDHAAGAA